MAAKKAEKRFVILNNIDSQCDVSGLMTLEQARAELRNETDCLDQIYFIAEIKEEVIVSVEFKPFQGA